MIKNLLFTVLGILTLSFSYAQNSDLIISEYIEGSSQNKAIEIYNGTGSSVDLSAYSLKKATNGADWSETVVFSGTLEHNDVYVISKSSADAAILAETDLEDGNVINFNGNDAMGLFKNDVLIDVFGIPTEDPGSAWDVAGTTGATKDHTIVRKASITSPTTDWAASAGTNTDDSQWIVYEKDDFSFIGSHNASTEPSTETDITAFTVTGQIGESVINTDNHTVVFEMSTGTDVSALVPQISISSGATITPESGVAQNFSAPVTYTVTAEDETTTQTWEVSVVFNSDIVFIDENFDEITPNENLAIEGWFNYAEVGTKLWLGKAYNNNSYAQFSSYNSEEENVAWLISPTISQESLTDNHFTFDINIGYWTHEGLQILVTDEYNHETPEVITTLNWTDITSEFTIPTEPTDAYGSFASAGTVDLTQYSNNEITIAFKYTGDGNNAETTTYQIDNVSVIGQGEVVISTETDIVSFELAEQTGSATIDNVNHTVAIEVFNGIDVSALTPTITISNGATINPASEVEQDFTDPVSYTVTAEDGETTQEWLVTVTVSEELSTEAEIIAFYLEEEIESAVIDSEAATVNAKVAWNTSLTALTPEITVSYGAQVTATTHDFTNPVVFTVEAQDGETTKDWTVTVTNGDAPSTEADIIGFELDELIAPVEIDNGLATIAGVVAYGTDVTTLAPTITVSEGATVTPESGVVQDFTNIVMYVVTAEDGVTEKYWFVYLTTELPELTSIYDIQYSTSGPSSYVDESVVTKGVVAATDSKGFYLQDGAGAWNGIYVYEGTESSVTMGDSVLINATVVEYGNLTELSDPVYAVINSGNTIASPTQINTVADFKNEMYEGVLVTLNEITCSAELDNLNWAVVDDNNDTLIVRNGIVDYTPTVGEYYASITGFSGQYYENYQLFPRSVEDIVLTAENEPFLNVEFYPNPVSSNLYLNNLATDSKVILSNILGQVISDQNINSNTIDMSNLDNGIYILTIVTNDNQRKSYRIIKE